MHVYFPQFIFKDVTTLGIFNSVITQGKADFHVTNRSGLFRGPFQLKFETSNTCGVYNSFVVFKLEEGAREEITNLQLKKIIEDGVHDLSQD